MIALVIALLTALELAARGVGAMPPAPRPASASVTIRLAPSGSPAKTQPVVRTHPVLTVRSAPASMRPSPVVKQGTGLWRSVDSSAYGIGDGFLGGHMACGGRLDSYHLTVAYRYLHTGRAELHCGDRIRIRLAGSHSLGIVVTVTDAGPFVGARIFDLGPAACHALGVCGIPRIEWKRS